ncbi:MULTISPECIES: M23 family metallopeptidase [unclassified Sphingomonas]|uniref:M23 family metallopeptidase n=1 Tax=unclassified Sphingomonas TaxID=196159 RepID=UPI000E7095DD|nr:MULTISPECIES: M23 family metallopeptidase [unclassified Sphingomonas]RKE50254.1 murein DD-endopeptidase MepM/ murein hydrolase activator NlpD [Sphingomonas sp. PP-CC-1A-547]TCM08589.1 murein DD-endopeptidase MepM/ murein hydrolase activator NlpD [Sphingomonas sp. PP-CC-3G-468]
MRRAGVLVSLATLMLTACIPHVDHPAGYGNPPRRPYRDPPPRRDDPPRPRDDSPREDTPRDDRQPQDIPGRDTGEVTTLPAPRPAWEARPVSADAKTIPDTTYVVRPGDTLSRVVDRSGASLEAIARANDLESPYSIQAGQRLQIPGGRYHQVRRGETGIAIARAYGVEWSRIVAANALVEPYVLRADQRIQIPGEPSGGTTSASERARAFSLAIDDILTGGEPALASNQAPARPIATPRRVLPSNAVVTAPARLASGGFLWPVDGKVVKRFGHGASGERNDGIKIAVPVSTPIHAAADGVVAYVGDGIAALGGLVIVKHGGGWTSVYGHASKLLVQRGQSVKRGQTIALSGDTGFADRPELHFELRKGRTPVDPTSQLPRT